MLLMYLISDPGAGAGLLGRQRHQEAHHLAAYGICRIPQWRKNSGDPAGCGRRGWSHRRGLSGGVSCWGRRRHDWLSYGWIVKILCVAIYAFWVYHMEKRHRWKWLLVLFMALALVAIALIARRDIARG